MEKLSLLSAALHIEQAICLPLNRLADSHQSESKYVVTRNGHALVLQSFGAYSKIDQALTGGKAQTHLHMRQTSLQTWQPDITNGSRTLGTSNAAQWIRSMLKESPWQVLEECCTTCPKTLAVEPLVGASWEAKKK